MFKLLFTLLICTVLSICIWCATIWNNFAFHNGLIADDYLLPVSVLALMVVVLAVNPVLRRFFPGLSFSRKWLCVICGVLFMAALPPSAGILRQLVFPLADSVRRANSEEPMAEAYEALSPPAVLYPDTLEYEAELPVIDPFMDKLEPGENVPWRAWVGPIAGWSGFVIPWYIMMIALAVIMTKYWQDEERVPFPLVTIFRSLVDVPDDSSRKIPSIFRNRVFWIGCLIVFLLHALAQAKSYFPEGVPAFPLSWHLGRYYSDPPWRYLGWWFKNGKLFFTFMAVAFFLPNRTSFSIWFVQVFTAFYFMIGKAYFPPFKGYIVNDTRTGAFLGFALFVVWLARRHLSRVVRCMVKGAATPRDRAYRFAGWCFVAGCAGMLAWFIWVRVPVVYGVAFVMAAVLASLTLMRAVCETGLPLFFLNTGTFLQFLRMIPLSLRSLPAMLFGGHLSVWLGSGQRLCVGAVATQALAVDGDDDVPRHVRLGSLYMTVLVVSIICAWLLILVMSYSYSETPDGRAVAWWGRQQFRPGENLLIDTIRGVSPSVISDHLPSLLTGGLLVVLLYNLCQLVPWWPLHPIGLLGTGTWCVAQIWPNVFFGWLIKNLIIRFGGAKAYTAARPFFIGMVMGELFALFLWSSIAGVLALNGLEYHSVTVLPY